MERDTKTMSIKKSFTLVGGPHGGMVVHADPSKNMSIVCVHVKRDRSEYRSIDDLDPGVDYTHEHYYLTHLELGDVVIQFYKHGSAELTDCLETLAWKLRSEKQQPKQYLLQL